MTDVEMQAAQLRPLYVFQPSKPRSDCGSYDHEDHLVPVDLNSLLVDLFRRQQKAGYRAPYLAPWGPMFGELWGARFLGVMYCICTALEDVGMASGEGILVDDQTEIRWKAQ